MPHPRTLFANVLVATLLSTVLPAHAEQAASREELLKAAVSRERGEVAAMEASSRNDGSAYIGYSSGALLHCLDTGSCSEFGGTPKLAVRRITVSAQADTDVVWVAYRHGALYRCAQNQCQRANWEMVP